MPIAIEPPRLTDAERHALATFWSYFEVHADAVNSALREALASHPAWGPVLRAMSAQQLDDQDRRSLALQRQAFVDGDWQPYLEDLRAQGARYAEAGVSFVAWYDVLARYRSVLRDRLRDLAAVDLERASRIGDGMNLAIDLGMVQLGEAYVATKERIIASQRDAIRELSLPILRLAQHVLVVPLVGALDAARASQLADDLLAAVRRHRARAIIIDVTGVPTIDSNVAGYLLRVTSAARLMGARVSLSGISSETAAALVALRASFGDVRTVADLEEAVAELAVTSELAARR